MTSLDGPLTLSELMGALRELDAQPAEAFPRSLQVGVSANVTVEPFGAAFRREAYAHGLRAEVTTGSFDAHPDNGRAFAGLDGAVYVALFDRLVPALESRAGVDSAISYDLVEAKHLGELRLFLAATARLKWVFVLGAHAFWPLPTRATADWIERLNAATRKVVADHLNARFLDAAAILRALGDATALNPRYYSQHKAPYTLAFWSAIAHAVAVETRAFQSRFHKVLIVDCDNTLWGGLIGEDLFAGIKLDPHDHPGSVFWRVQHELAALERRGVLLCLCSKNDAIEVDEVLAKHPNTVLRDEHFIIKKVNWRPKPDNLREIAAELNLGLDSLAFLDDSDFECESVRSQLPQVTVFQVPKSLHEYPSLVRRLGELFPEETVTAESAAKTEQYRALAEGARERATFASQADYLASLGLVLDVRTNERGRLGRIAELINKSNQFNVTTRRYTESEVSALMDNPATPVVSLSVKDRFGDHGLVGVLVTRDEVHDATKVLVIDTFLMSCRIIGRGIEFAFWGKIFGDARARGCLRVEAEYRQTAKNALVRSFFDELGLPVVLSSAGVTRYAAALDGLPLPTQNHIELLIHG
jgi:FkbH-like protein